MAWDSDLFGDFLKEVGLFWKVLKPIGKTVGNIYSKAADTAQHNEEQDTYDLLERTERGDQDAQFELGQQMINSTSSNDADKMIGLQLIQRAAKQGHIQAKLFLEHNFPNNKATFDYKQDEQETLKNIPLIQTAQEPTALTSPLTTKTTIQVTKTRIGRNGPCPCGSGLKYKKCCGVNADDALISFQSSTEPNETKIPVCKSLFKIFLIWYNVK